jgi:hypothetical protein
MFRIILIPTFVISFIGFGQNNFYSPFYPDIYINSDTNGILYHQVFNSKIIDSINANYRSVTKFYDSNTVSMRFIILSFKVKVDKEYQYILGGKVTTYYRNKNIRSTYEIDSNGVFSDINLFNEEGVKVGVIEMKDNRVYNGLEIYPIKDPTEGYLITQIKDGQPIKYFLVSENNIYEFGDNNDLIETEESSILKLSNQYNFFSSYIQCTPPNF